MTLPAGIALVVLRAAVVRVPILFAELLQPMPNSSAIGDPKRQPDDDEPTHGTRLPISRAPVLPFCRVHQTLTQDASFKMTPAMAAGVADHVWTLDELAALMPEPTVAAWGSRKAAAAAAESN